MVKVKRKPKHFFENQSDDTEEEEKESPDQVKDLSFEELLNQSMDVEEKEALKRFFKTKHDNKHGTVMSLNKESIELLKLDNSNTTKLKNEFINQYDNADKMYDFRD